MRDIAERAVLVVLAIGVLSKGDLYYKLEIVMVEAYLTSSQKKQLGSMLQRKQQQRLLAQLQTLKGKLLKALQWAFNHFAVVSVIPWSL